MRSPERVLPRLAALALFVLLAGCVSHVRGQTQGELEACVGRLQPAAQKAGIDTAAYRQFTRDARFDATVLEKLDYQPEFRLPIWDYLAGLVDDERVADGMAMLAEHRAVLQKVEAAYGVDPATVVAVWGVESNYGRITGKYPLVSALGTLSCFGRRQDYFRGEFFAALRILQRGDIAPERLNGSWAGAFGHTQFMPATYERLAVDFDGDGRRDLVDNSTDALASTANFLRRGGWQTGQPWGFEVRLPAGFDAALAGRKQKRPLADWGAMGIVAVDGSPMARSGLASGDKTAILLPAGARGPAFLVTRNFDVIYGYNAAESYALAIAHLSDRLRGGGHFATPWPTDDPGLSRAERRELQTLLTARGHDIGEIDGALGDRSRAAIKLEQARLGQDATGRGGQKILRALRAESTANR
ncbi:MAG: lytic murein transglycosylase [Betaproteobacteria bacterium]|nr:lytic murein transglycosylase [Betaproteobacteria bacterium]